MRSRKSELIVAAGLGIGGFILGFISAKLTSRKHDQCDFFGDYDKFSKDDNLKFGQSFDSKLKDKPKTKTAAERDKILHEAGVPAGLVLNVDKTRRLDQIIERGMVKTLPDGNEVLGSPLKYGTWNSYGLQKDAPELDEQGEQIRKEFE